LADRVLLPILGLILGLGLGTAWADEEAADEETSDVEFIEYLGLWEGSDDEWLMLAEEKDNEETPEMEPEAEDES
jgi:hypothetical protein